MQMTFLPETAAGFRDPAFSKNRQLPLHRWVPWVAGFSAGFVDDCLKKYLSNSPREDTWVLDPFAGVGTTLLEAYTQGLNVIGFEINPYAALAAKLKLEALHIPKESLCKHIAAFERFMEKSCSRNDRCLPRSRPPSGFSG